MSKKVYLALGSNVGDSRQNVLEAAARIGEILASDIELSSLWQTEPVGMTDDSADFINAVLTAETEFTPEELLAEMQRLEQAMGRPKDHGFHEARTIDIDLLGYEGVRCQAEQLTLPHPRTQERLFVLYPLSELVTEFEFSDGVSTVESQIRNAPVMAITRLLP